MRVYLKATRGSLKSTDGSDAANVEIRRLRFLIGSAEDCHLCCPSTHVSPRHCEVRVAGVRVAVRDLGSAEGTWVNGQRIDEERTLIAGDLLRIGRLEFEVVIDATAVAPKPEKAAAKSAPRPAGLDGDVTDLLESLDEEDRAKRMANLDALRFRDVPAGQTAAAVKRVDKEEEKPKDEGPKKAKLPQKPKVVAKDSVEAAELGLRRLFGIG